MSDITPQLELLDTWITVCLTFAAIFVTAFPLLYSLSPWYRSALGRALMFKALAFAVAVDMTLVFRLWDEPVLLAYWASALAFTFIAVATGGLVAMLLYHNFYLGDDHDDTF